MKLKISDEPKHVVAMGFPDRLRGATVEVQAHRDGWRLIDRSNQHLVIAKAWMPNFATVVDEEIELYPYHFGVTP